MHKVPLVSKCHTQNGRLRQKRGIVGRPEVEPAVRRPDIRGKTLSERNGSPMTMRWGTTFWWARAQPLEQIDSLLSPVLVRGRLIGRRRRLLPSAIGHRQVLMRVKKKAVPLSRDCQQLTKLEQIGVGFRKFQTYFHWASSRTTLLIILRFSPRDSTNHVHSIRCHHSMYLSFERCSLTQIAGEPRSAAAAASLTSDCDIECRRCREERARK